MIDREILKDMGFILGHGWDHEVYFHDSNFWVHFGGEPSRPDGSKISGTASMKEFFDMFYKNIENSVIDNSFDGR